MKQLNQFIQEKFIINKDTTKYAMYQSLENFAMYYHFDVLDSTYEHGFKVDEEQYEQLHNSLKYLKDNKNKVYDDLKQYCQKELGLDDDKYLIQILDKGNLWFDFYIFKKPMITGDIKLKIEFRETQHKIITFKQFTKDKECLQYILKIIEFIFNYNKTH